MRATMPNATRLIPRRVEEPKCRLLIIARPTRRDRARFLLTANSFSALSIFPTEATLPTPEIRPFTVYSRSRENSHHGITAFSNELADLPRHDV